MSASSNGRKSFALRGGAAFLSGFTGLLFIILGAAALFEDWGRSHRMIEVAALPTVAAAGPGQRAVLEGTITPEVPILQEGFVVLKRRQHQKAGSDWQTWVQPLSVATSSGVVAVVNNNYVPDPWPATWGHESRVLSAPGWTQGAVTIEGLLPGREIMAVGVLVERSWFSAETIAAGPRARYLEALKASAADAAILMWLYLLIGPLLMAYGVWDIVRIAREA